MFAMKTIYYTIIALAAIGLFATSTSETFAMEEKTMTDKKMMDDKAMADKKVMADKAMADKAMSDKKTMSAMTHVSEIKKLVSNIEKSLTANEKAKPEIKSALSRLKTAISAMEKVMSDKKMTSKSMADKKVMTDKAMADKTMSDKMMDDKMEHKTLKIGGIDLTSASPLLGSKDAKITIIEFGDYQCPKCGQWFKSEEPKIKSQYINTNKANLYFVDFAWLGSDSERAANAAHCADEQGKFWQYHDTLYTSQGGIQSGWASSDSLKKIAKNTGLDTTKFDQCLDSDKHKQHVEFNTNLGKNNDVTATPVFFIVGNGKVEKIEGPQPTSAFTAVIEKLLK